MQTETMKQMEKHGMKPPAGAVSPMAHRWAAMIVLLTANFINALDVSVVNIALPNLQDNLHASERQLEWVVEIYLLAYAVALLPFARLGDIVGRRRMILAGMLGFTLSSAFCGAAPDSNMLIVARGLQGLCAAMMSSQIMAIAQTMFAPKERAKVFPLFGLVGGLSGITGPLVSGILLHLNFYDLGWRLVYLINIPLGVVIYVAALVWVPRCPPHVELKNDVLGITLATAGILCVVYPLVEGRVHEWPAWTFAMLAACIPLLYGFVSWERHQENRQRSALLPVYLLASREYLIGAAAILGFFSAMLGFFVVFALFLQQGLLFSSLQAGIAIAPFPIGMMLASPLSARIPNLKVKLITGATVLSVVFGVMAAIVYAANIGALRPASFGMPLLFGGVASGLCISSLFQGVMRTIPLKDAGAGSGTIQVVQQIGGCVGIALVSAIFFSGTALSHASVNTEAVFKAAFLHTLAYPIVVYLLVAAAGSMMKFALPPGAANQPEGIPHPAGPGSARGPAPTSML